MSFTVHPPRAIVRASANEPGRYYAAIYLDPGASKPSLYGIVNSKREAHELIKTWRREYQIKDAPIPQVPRTWSEEEIVYLMTKEMLDYMADARKRHITINYQDLMESVLDSMNKLGLIEFTP